MKAPGLRDYRIPASISRKYSIEVGGAPFPLLTRFSAAFQSQRSCSSVRKIHYAYAVEVYTLEKDPTRCRRLLAPRAYDRNKLHKFWGKVEISLVCILIVIVWILLSLPVVFYHLPVEEVRYLWNNETMRDLKREVFCHIYSIGLLLVV